MPNLLRPIRPALLLGALLATSLGPGCASSGRNQVDRGDLPEDFVPLPIEKSEVALLMLELDKTIKSWQQGVNENNETRRLQMESILRTETNDSFDEVVEALEAAAPGIRQTAAAALGFSGRTEAISPLSNALGDPDPKVVSNALVGLGQLADPGSPLSTISFHLRSSSNELIRNNAAFALGRILVAGAEPNSDVLEACRQGLYDSFAGVRSQCASVLGHLRDSEAVPDLSTLLVDDEDLAAKPAILALGEIARGDPRQLGEVARALADGMGRTKRTRKSWIRAELIRLSERDYENDLNAWREWAYSLP